MLRIDKFLWFARLTKTRAQAQALACGGHLRIDGRVCQSAHAAVRPGSVLSFALHDRVRVIRVDTLPGRRGPPAEARAHYADLLAPPPAGETASAAAPLIRPATLPLTRAAHGD